jgi:UDP-GlcNAc:undecaprenyl-phosphate GlcNAc-1-phosphate transferase
MSGWDVVRPGLVAAAVTIASMPVVLAAIRRFSRPDVPNERSSHTVVTPRGGGLACLLGAAAGTLTISGIDRTLGLAAVTILLFASVGFADDVHPLPVPVRLACQLVCGSSGLTWASRLTTFGAFGIVYCILVVIVLVGFTNVFNFMDGINGISGLHAAVFGASLAIAAWHVSAEPLAAMCVTLAAAGLAFLPFNLRRRPVVFLGDIGSYLFGAGAVTLAVVTWRSGATFESAVAPFAVYLADTTSTVVSRARRGENVFAAHRQHVYQRLTPPGAAHAPVAGVVAALSAVTAVLGLVTLEADGVVRVAADTGVVVVAVGYLLLPQLRHSRQVELAA